jgi:hypothetical protein
MGFYGNGPHSLDAISGVTSSPVVELGTRRWVNGEEYVYCYNNTGSAATAGAAMVTSGISGFSFTRSSTASLDLPMCFVKHAAPDVGQYFWGLVRGSVNVLSATISAGNPITIGNNGAVASSFPTGVVFGKMLEAASGSTASLAYVKCYG